LVDQKLWIDPHNSQRNVGLLGWIGIADDNPNVIRGAGSVTLKANGLIPGRERDSFGVGYFYTGLSDNFKELVGDVLSLQAQERVALQDSQGFEAYYKFGLTPWLAMTADVQVIQPNTVGLDTAVVAGVRTKVKF
jgi:porin